MIKFSTKQISCSTLRFYINQRKKKEERKKEKVKQAERQAFLFMATKEEENGK